MVGVLRAWQLSGHPLKFDYITTKYVTLLAKVLRQRKRFRVKALFDRYSQSVVAATRI